MTVTVLKLTEGLGLTEAGIRVFEDINWNGQRTAATGQGILWGDSEGEEDVFVLPDYNALFLQYICRCSCIANCTAGHCRWWSRWPAYSSRWSALCHSNVICLSDFIFEKVFLQYKHKFFLSQNKSSGNTPFPNFNVPFRGKYNTNSTCCVVCVLYFPVLCTFQPNDVIFV